MWFEIDSIQLNWLVERLRGERPREMKGNGPEPARSVRLSRARCSGIFIMARTSGALDPGGVAPATCVVGVEIRHPGLREQPRNQALGFGAFAEICIDHEVVPVERA